MVINTKKREQREHRKNLVNIHNIDDFLFELTSSSPKVLYMVVFIMIGINLLLAFMILFTSIFY